MFHHWGPLPALAANLLSMECLAGIGMDGYGSSWGLHAIHPWAKDEMKKLLEEQKKLALEQEEGMGLGGGMGDGMEYGGQMTGPSTGTFSPFGDTEMSMEEGMSEEYDEDMMMGYGPDGEGMMLGQDYCLFRFIDTSIEPVGFIIR